MKNKLLVLLVILSFTNCENRLAQNCSYSRMLPNDFAEETFDHILNITNVGVHTAGSIQERQVSDYIMNELSNLGIQTSIEKFEFESFDITETDLVINQHQIEALQVCFNPYAGKYHFQGDFSLLDSNNTTKANIGDKIVVASFPLENSKYFQLFVGRPQLILVIPAKDFQRLAKENKREFNCTINGEIKQHISQNVVGTLPGKRNNADEIILSAHYDSYPGSVGADDNASGVGVLIELAHFFKQYQNRSTVNLKFVAFGGEEKGLLGSRAYLDRHYEELPNCKLVFNVDQIGGEHIFVETTGGVQGISLEKGKSQFPGTMRSKSLEGIDSNWRLLAPEVLPLFAMSNRPEWLADIIKESTAELSVPVSFAGNTGSDQMIFAQAGIVASAIGTSGNEVHSAKDVPSQINKQSLLDCGEIVTRIVLKTMERD